MIGQDKITRKKIIALQNDFIFKWNLKNKQSIQNTHVCKKYWIIWFMS